MRRLLPLLWILLAPVILFPALVGPEVVSADDHLSVHHAFQTEAGGRVRHPQLSDPALQFSALRARVVASLRRGEAPLWTPDLWGGAPLLADGQSMAGSPVTWLRLIAPEDIAQDLGVWWILSWTGLGTALVARRLGCGPWAAAAAGSAAMTGPWFQVWLLHPHAATAAWLPWVIWGVERRGGPALALACAGLLAGGHPETAAHGLGIAGAWALARRARPLLRAARDPQQRRVGLTRLARELLELIAAVGVGVLLSAPIWLPLLEQIGRSATLEAHGGNRLAPGALMDLVWPGWWGHPAREGWSGPGTWSDAQLHPGPGALLLALAALRGSRGRGLWAGWALCLAAAVVGLPGPMNHSRLGALGAWLLAPAVGLGVANLRALRGGRAALAAGLVLALGWAARRDDQGALPPELHAPAPAPWTEALRAAAGDSPVIGLGWALQPNTGALVGLRDLRGYDLPVARDVERVQAALQPALIRPWFMLRELPERSLLRFLGVSIVLTPDPSDPPPAPDAEPVPLGEAPLSAWRIGPELPRAWLATAPRAAENPDAALRRVASDASARARPPVEGLDRGAFEATAAPEAIPLAWSGGEGAELRVRLADRAGVVALADAWAPGWAVEVDGAPGPACGSAATSGGSRWRRRIGRWSSATNLQAGVGACGWPSSGCWGSPSSGPRGAPDGGRAAPGPARKNERKHCNQIVLFLNPRPRAAKNRGATPA